MQFAEVLNLLDVNARTFAETLTASDLANILSAVYRLPSLMLALKNTPNISPLAYGSADIGKRGEQEFERIASRLPSDFSLINTAKQGKQGDFILKYTNDGKEYICLVDIKNYKSPVPKKEIDKFYSDMTFGHYDAGLMVSYGSKFTGIDNNIAIESKPLAYATVPVMYCADISPDLMLECIKVLFLKLQVTKDKQTDISYIQSAIACVNNALGQSSMTRRLLSDLQMTVSTQIQRCQENLLGGEIQIKRATEELQSRIKHVSNNTIEIKDPDTANTTNTANTTIDVTPDELSKEHYSFSSDDDDLKELKEPVSKPIEITTKYKKLTNSNLDIPVSDDIANSSSGVNYSKFATNSRSFASQLIADHEWTTVTDSNTETILENPTYTVKLMALKTKTRITVIPKDEHSIPANLLVYLKKKRGFMCNELNNSIAKNIKSLFK
jgi:hypothetical protein